MKSIEWYREAMQKDRDAEDLERQVQTKRIYVIFNPFYQIDDVTGANKENWCVFYFNPAWIKLTIEYLLFLGCWDGAKCASSLWLAALQRETEVTTAPPSPKMFRDIKWPIMSENSDVQCSGAWLRYVQKCMFNVQQHSIFNVKCSMFRGMIEKCSKMHVLMFINIQYSMLNVKCSGVWLSETVTLRREGETRWLRSFQSTRERWSLPIIKQSIKQSSKQPINRVDFSRIWIFDHQSITIISQ